ncbi:MAG: ribonuclease H-like domain-containing protein [Chloroflexota bacterium]|jgi:hypothetical protein
MHTIDLMSDDFQKRLRRLGVVKGARKLKSPPNPAPAPKDWQADEPATLESLLPGGHLERTDLGSCFVLDHVYPLSYAHGTAQLGELCTAPMGVTAQFGQDERLVDFSFRDLLFLDTETTGLSGAGTVAFMVGVAFFGDKAFVVRQYFLRDHSDEPAMLSLLADLLAERPLLVTFNGRSFDIPLLDTRYLMNRLDDRVGNLREQPHIDLLPPARRLWRRRLESCALGSLEESLLDIHRTHEDVPGWVIPGLYMDYLRSGDARQLVRVFYHNRIDMLSMVTLTHRIVRQFAQPQRGDEPLDLLSLARWQVALDMQAEAESNLRQLLSGETELDAYKQALSQLAWLLKRQDRRPEAVPLWQQLAVTAYDDVSAHVELAKYYEWHDIQLDVALHWTAQALSLVAEWEPAKVNVVIDELQHRRSRLERKLAIDGDEGNDEEDSSH